MTTDIENELRELFRDKAGEAPLAAPASAPPQVLRRGRRRQLGTVAGSLAAVVVVIAGSVAGLQRLLADGPEPLPTATYDVFERTATVEAFTVTSPSDWYLVNQWPLSMQIAVEGSGGASSTCAAVPGNDVVECEDTPGVETRSPIPVPQGLPMLQLTNVDLGLDTNACEDEIPDAGAALYVALDAERAIAGVADPTIPPFPAGPGLPPEGDGPCGPGRYASFTVNGEPFFAWIGLGSSVTAEDRETVESAYERMSAIPDWTPQPPNQLTPGYVIAGGTSDAGDVWRLEARPGRDVTISRVVEGSTTDFEFALGSEPVSWCCSTDHPGQADGVVFGVIQLGASGVAFQPVNKEAIHGTIVPTPPSLGSGFDLFLVEGARGPGDVVAIGLGTGAAVSPAPSAFPTATPRSDEVELSGAYEEQEWQVRFTGAFTGPGSPCWEVTVDGPPSEACPDPVHSTIAGPSPYMVGFDWPSLYLLAGSVPPEVAELRFSGDDDAIVPQQFQCGVGPIGWTDPDRKVCAIALPATGSGTLRYIDADGVVLFEEGIGWGAAEAALPPGVVSPTHGGTYWAVYPWIGAPGDREADDVSAQLLDDFGIEAFPGELGCDQGAAEALGRTDVEHAIGVYFGSEEDANAFARAFGALGDNSEPIVARVTTYCLD